MKKNKALISIILAFIFFTINVYAESLGYYLSNSELKYNYDSAPNEIMVKRGDYIYVTAVINNVNESDLILKSGNVTVRWEDKYMELVSYKDNTFYSTLQSDFPSIVVNEEAKTNNKITVSYKSSDLVKTGINKIVEFKFHVLENAAKGTTKIYEMDGETKATCLKNEEEVNCANSYNTELKYKIQSSDVNTLSSLKIDGKVIDNFNENKKEYLLNIDEKKESINIEAIEKDSKSSISGDIGTRSLQYGLNTFNIVVTSESGISNTYTLKVTRLDGRSKDNTLKNLKLSSGIIPFKSNINEYNISVKNEIDTVTIIATLNDPKAKFKEDFSKKEIDLIEGMNKVAITVIAENGTENTYTINITRELSNNNTLKELTVNDEKIKLNKNDFLYYYTVKNDVDTISVKALATDNKAIVEIDPVTSLSVGENEVGIRVTAPNGEFVNYTLIITREQLLSSNSKLLNLEIVGYKLDFKSDVEYYDLKINDEDELEIITETEDEKAVVNIEGNKNLVNGSIIKITVKAEDNSHTRYFITIEKSKKSNLLLLILILLMILILTIIIIILIKRNKKRKSIQKEKITEVSDNNESMPYNENEQALNIDEEKDAVEKNDVTISLDEANKVLDNNEEKADNKKNVTKKRIDLE